MLTIRLDSDVPIAVQIGRAVRRRIAAGQLGVGDELPTVRQLASDLGVNLNTVARAYRSLEQRGLATSTRGRGTRVAASAEPATRRGPDETNQLSVALRDALADMRLAGHSRDEARALVIEAIDEFWPQASRGGADAGKE